MRSSVMRRAALLALILAAHGCGGESAARVEHNQGLAALAAKSFEEAEKKLLAARDHAGGDDELRERAAYHLGLAHARHAESLPEDQAEHAIDLYRQGASWLRDAVRLDPDDREARQTLEVVLRRIQVLVDKLGREEGKLEARLDRLIEDQRGLLTSIRALLGEIARAGASSDPIGFRAEFDAVATAERQLGAEAGAIADLAADEAASIRAQPEDQRTPEQAGRLVALESMTSYTDGGRQAAAEVRLALRRLEGQVAHARGDAALAQWKRAREQLMDPVSVLQRVAGDQRETSAGTELLAKLQSGAITLKPSEGPAEKPAGPPPWLTAEILAQGEKDAGDRAGEVRARLDAFSQAPAAGAQPAQPGQPAQPEAKDPEMERLQASAKEALPHLDKAITAIGAAGAALGGAELGPARARQTEAEDSLFRAIELFAGLRQLIELAYGQEASLVALLDPKNDEAAKLPAEERGRLVTDGAARNLERVKRLAGLLAAEKAKDEAQAAQAAAQASQHAGQPGAPAPTDQEAAGRAELYTRAEAARAGAEAALVRLDGEVRAGARPGKSRALADAQEALQHIDELRRLFFTLIERLKELRAKQGETHDGTATAQAADDAARARTVPPLAEAEAEHAQVGQALAMGMAAESDQAAEAGGQGGDPKAAEAAENMRKATDEVRAAQEQMTDAARVLGEARDTVATQSTDLGPAVTAQASALDHLDEAIRLLEPPQPEKDEDKKDQDQKQGEQDKDQKDQQKGDEGQDKQPSPDEKVSAQQAERRMQAIRDREAERRREREKRQQSRPEPVDKDW